MTSLYETMQKLALTPLALGAMGAGIGAGVGAVHGFRTDDPSESVEHHVLRGARNALIGAGIGTGVGVGSSAIINKVSPELVESTAYYGGALPLGVVNGIRVAIQSPYLSWRRVVPNILRYFGRNIDGVRRDAFGLMADAGLLTGIAGTHASAGYGLYRGGKALHDRLAPPAPEEKIAFDLGAIRRRISTLPNAMRDAFMGSKPTMMAPMVRRTAPTLPRPVPGSYRHTPGAVHGGMLEQAAPTMLAPMTRQSAPQAIEQWANYRGSGSMIDSMAQRAGQLGYPEAAKARTLGEFRDAFTRRGYSPQEVFAPTDPAMMGRMNPVKTQWQTTSKVGSILARFGLHEKLADSLADHGRAAVYGFGSGVLNGVERPYRALRYGMPVEMRYLLNRNIRPSTRTDAAAALAGSLVVPTALAYGAYRGGKALYNKLSPQEDAEMTPKQAELEAPGEEGGAHLPRALGHLGVGTAFGYGAYHAGMGGAERLLGAQRFLHGTSDHAAEGILREGLQPRFGGSGSAAINPDYVNSSRGFSHVAVGPRSGMMARFYANLGEHEARSPGSLDGVQEKLMGVFSRPDPLKALTDDPKLKGTIKEMVGGSLGAPGYRKGTVLHGAMPYESFLKKFIPDTDQPSGFKTREEVTGLSRSSTGLRDMWRNRASDMLQYVRNNPRRVGVGAGLTAMGLGLGYGGYKQLRKAYGDVRGETPEQGIKQAVLARYGLDKVADIDKKITGEILMADIGKKTAGMKLALTPEAIRARRHMGAYSSSLDRSGG